MDANTRSDQSLWIDYLRSSITVLVVAHHSSLAYTTFAQFDKNAYINSTNPIVDPKRWVGLDIFENFNDVFFMFLMFFIGGLFIAGSVQKKGVFRFVKDRTYRLFLPFLLGGTSLMLLAYFPSYYVAYGNTDVIFYLEDFFTTERWPVGPPWFIWVLFAFNILVALSFPVISKLIKTLSKKISSLKDRPALFFLLVYFMTWVLYVPIAYHVGAGTWTGLGPFDFQLSRIIAYLGYFVLGVIIGAADFNNQLFSPESRLIKKWKVWIVLSLLLYAVITLNHEYNVLGELVQRNKMQEMTAWLIYYSVYTASCTASCMAFISLFRSQITKPHMLLSSLSENAYLIYLIHYVFIVWTQFLLLPFGIPAFLKFLMVFVISLVLSWMLSKCLRRIPFIKKYV